MYQQGNFTLTEGVKDYTVGFSTTFPVTAPPLILTDIFNSDEEDPQDFLEGSIITRTTTEFTFSLITAPPNGNYVLSWMASDGLGNTPVTSNGLPVSDLPIFSGTSLPDNTRFPVVIPNGAYKSVAVRWQQIKNLMAASHQHNVEDISDSGSIGRALVKVNTDKAAAREVIDAARTDHTHDIVDINGTGVIGVGILEAGTAAEVRALIDVSPVAHTHTASQISNSSTIGRSILTANDAAAVRTAISAANTTHTHAPSDIVAHTIITELLTSTTEAGARSAIDAANVIGWETTATLSISRDLVPADFGAKFLVDDYVTYTIPYNITSLGRICFYVSGNDYLTIYPEGGVTVNDPNGNPIIYSSLPKGLYILESVGTNTFCLTGYLSTFQRGLAAATDTGTFVTALGLTIDDLGVNDSLDDVFAATSQRELNAAVNTYEYTPITVTNASTYLHTNPAGKFFYTTLTALDIYSLPGIQDTQSFIIHNAGTSDLVVTPTASVTINNSVRAVRIPPKDYLEFIKNGNTNLTCHYSVLPSSADQFTAYVAVHGNNATGVVGDITKPFASVPYALEQLTNPDSKRSVVVLPGNYAGASIACEVSHANTHITFMPGTYVSVTTGERLFYQTQGSLFIKGGNFIISNDGQRFAALSDATGGDIVEFNADVESIKVLNASSTVPVIQTTNVSVPTSYTKILKAETIECPTRILAQVGTDALTIKVRNLTTGAAAVSIQTGRVNLSISDGRYNCGNTLLSTSTTSGTLNLSLYNTVVKQGGSVSINAPILDPIAASNTIRVDGVGSSIEGTYTFAATGVATGRTNLGTLIISNVTIIGSLIIDSGTLTLNSVFINPSLNTSTTGDLTDRYNSIYSSSAKNVYILGTVCSTGSAAGTITTIGGALIVDLAFAI
jgi:hypothetical protein